MMARSAHVIFIYRTVKDCLKRLPVLYNHIIDGGWLD